MSDINANTNVNAKQKFGFIYKYQNIVILLLLLGIGIFANLIMFNLPLKIDMTKSKIYTLSDVTIRMLKELEEPLQVSIYLSKDIPATLNGTTLKRTIIDLMDDLKAYGQNNFSYNLIEIGAGKEDDKKRAEAVKLGIEPITVEIPERIKKTTAQIIAGINITYENYQDVLQIDLRDPSKLEYEFVKLVNKMLTNIPLRVSLRSLKNPIKITSYFTRHYNNPQLKEPIKKALEEFINIDPSKMIYEEKLVQTDADLDKVAEYDIAVKEVGVGKYGSFVQTEYICFGIVFEHETKSKTIPNVLNLVGNETIIKKQFEEKIKSVLPKEYKVGIFAKPYDILPVWSELNKVIIQKLQLDQIQLQQYEGIVRREADRFENPNFQYLISLSEEFYDIEMIKENEIDQIQDRYQALVIASTNQELTDWELYQIDQYLMSGKPVIFLANAVAPNYLDYLPFFQQQQQLFTENAVRSKHNLFEILEHYGVKLEENLIYGAQGFTTGDGYRYPLWVAINKYEETPVTKNFNLRTQFGWASNLKVNETELAEKGITAKPFLETTSNAALVNKEDETDYTIDILQYVGREDKENITGEEGQFTIGYLLEGKFPSYFKGKPIPEKSDKSGGNAGTEANTSSNMEMPKVDESKTTKLIVVSDRDFVTDWMAQFIGYGVMDNIALMQNILDYCLGQNQLLPLRGKSVSPPQLNVRITDKYHRIILWGNVLGLPLLIIILKIVLVIIERKKRKALFNKFNKKFNKEKEVNKQETV